MNKIFLHATYLCNANCIHCAVPKNNNSISFKDYKKLVNIASEEKVTYLIIGGGEPLLHKDLEKMIRYGFENGLKMKIETNGYLLTKEFLESIKPYIFQINISLDGSKSTTHNEIRRLKTFEHTIKMIKYARKINIDVAVWSVLMKRNIEEALSLIHFVGELGVNKISFLYATPVGNCYYNKNEILIDPKYYYIKFKELYNQNSKKIQVRVAPYLIPKDKIEEFKQIDKDALNTYCLMLKKESIQVDPFGDIYPCVLLLHNKEFVFGNIKNKESFIEILKGKGKWENLDQILNNQKENERYGCLGLKTEFKTRIDPRIKYGVPICPCLTIKKEWFFDAEEKRQ